MKKLSVFAAAFIAAILCIALLPTEAQAASESNLTFYLNSDGISCLCRGTCIMNNKYPCLFR